MELAGVADAPRRGPDRARGGALPTRSVVAALLGAAILCGSLSVWRLHATASGRRDTHREARERAEGWLPHEGGDGRRGGGRGDGGTPRLPSIAAGEAPSTTVRPRHRVYCMVPLIWTPAALPIYRAIRASWGKRCHVLRFFVDPIVGDKTVGFHNATTEAGAVAAREAGVALPDDAVVLHGMRRLWHARCGSHTAARLKEFGNCRNIWEKIWRMIVYVGHGSGGTRFGDGRQTEEDGHEPDAFNAEWFVKVDADTFLFPENVGRFAEAKRWSHDDHHYFGHVLNHRQEDRGVSIVAGGAVFLSRATLLAGAAAFAAMPLEPGYEEEDGTCRDAYTGTDEVVTAVCLLERAGVTATPALDPAGREMVSLYEADDILTYNRTAHGEWWFWEGKERFPCHDAGDCLARLPVAFHGYKDSRAFLDLEKEFYGSVATGEADKTLVRTKDGRVASRRWPNFDITQRYFERVRVAMKEAETEESRGSATSNARWP